MLGQIVVAHGVVVASFAHQSPPISTSTIHNLNSQKCGNWERHERSSVFVNDQFTDESLLLSVTYSFCRSPFPIICVTMWRRIFFVSLVPFCIFMVLRIFPHVLDGAI